MDNRQDDLRAYIFKLAASVHAGEIPTTSLHEVILRDVRGAIADVSMGVAQRGVQITAVAVEKALHGLADVFVKWLNPGSSKPGPAARKGNTTANKDRADVGRSLMALGKPR